MVTKFNTEVEIIASKVKSVTGVLPVECGPGGHEITRDELICMSCPSITELIDIAIEDLDSAEVEVERARCRLAALEMLVLDSPGLKLEISMGSACERDKK